MAELDDDRNTVEIQQVRGEEVSLEAFQRTGMARLDTCSIGEIS
ncbi:hypothetical protein OOT46_03970 [Aquabacterium sp. A7-Y]|nr:hypothetical protein [Aquabacterium sp. A7-Y]MCW7537011.1 hypothetical protein [Aquabacterium sp. A7-Y]